MTAELADEEVVDSIPYLITLPLYVILFVLELVIFLHFAIKTHGLDISPIIRYFALSIGFIVLCILSLELWSILVDLSTTFPTQSTTYCFIQNYFRYISFVILESTLFIFWLIRLKHTFFGSMFSLSNKFTYSMFLLIAFLTLILMIICAISIEPQYFEIDLSFDSSKGIGYGCTTVNNIGIIIFFIAGQFIAVVFNIFFGFYFYHKLKKFVEMVCNQSSKRSAAYRSPDALTRQNVISLLMQKHTLLALITVCSAIVSYVTLDIILYIYDGFLWQYAFIMMDIDMVIKTSTCILMFKFYEHRFFQLCCCCIKIAAMRCECQKKNRTSVEISLFQPLANKAKIFAELRSNQGVTTIYTDEHGEDKNIFKAETFSGTIPKSDININNTNNTNNNNNNNKMHMTITMPKEEDEYILGKYTFLALLVKAKMADNNVNRRIFQYAMRNENIDDEEGIFRKIDQQYNLFGYIMDNNRKVFFFKNKDCKFPFICSIKLETETIKDGNIISKYVSKRISDTLNKLTTVKGFNYELLFETIIKEIRSNNIDLTGIRLSNEPSKKKHRKQMKSKQKIIPLPLNKKLGSSGVIPSQSRDSHHNHTPIQPYNDSGFNIKPNRDTQSLFGNKNNEIHTANQIQMHQYR